MDNIAAKILRLIELKGISYAELSQQTSISKSALQRYATGETTKIPLDRVTKIAEALGVLPAYLMGWEDEPLIPGAIPYVRGRRIPILGRIHAGAPLAAVENIEGHDYADVPEGEEYFFLRVKGDSMINAGINTGDLVLVKQQSCAENGNIVVCMVNGDETTLKRYFLQGETVILQPENSDLNPFR